MVLLQVWNTIALTPRPTALPETQRQPHVSTTGTYLYVFRKIIIYSSLLQLFLYPCTNPLLITIIATAPACWISVPHRTPPGQRTLYPHLCPFLNWFNKMNPGQVPLAYFPPFFLSGYNNS
jgi:hypothetical protein